MLAKCASSGEGDVYCCAAPIVVTDGRVCVCVCVCVALPHFSRPSLSRLIKRRSERERKRGGACGTTSSSETPDLVYPPHSLANIEAFPITALVL